MSLTERRPDTGRRSHDRAESPGSPPLPLVVAGALAGAAAALLSYAVLAIVALAAWMLDPAAPWEWSHMLEAASAGWLAGQGVPLVILETPVNLPPVGFGLLCVVAIMAATRWAAGAAAVARRGEAVAVALSAAVPYGFSAAVLAGLGRHLGAVPWQAGVIAGSIALVVALATLVVRVRLIEPRRAPRMLVDASAAALTAVLVMVIAAAFALGAMIVIHADEVARVLGGLGLGAAGGLLVVALSLGYLPVALMWSLAYLLGPGFAVSSTTTISAFGPAGSAALPGLPILAAIPPDPPGGAVLLPLVGVVAGALMAALLRRRDWNGLPGLAAAAAAAALVGLILAALALVCSGSLGSASLSLLGPTPIYVGLAAFGTTLLGGAAVVIWPPREGGPDLHG